MRYDIATTYPPPDPKRPPSLIALILQALLLALVFQPAPAATASVAPAAALTREQDWAPPVADATEADVLKAFLPPEMPWSAAHRGIDIRAQQSDVVAPAGGEIHFVGDVVDRPVLSIRHDNGLISSFEPVESELEVGDAVTQGQIIGSISDEAGHCDTQCVHWGVRKPDAWHIGSTVRDLYIDPAFLLGWSDPSILWPVHSDPVA